MKQGNQFYLTIQLEDSVGNSLDINVVKKIQFVIGNLVKTYEKDSVDVTYDEENQYFKIWLTEEETFNFDKSIKIDARILFTNDTIGGTYIESIYWYDALKKEVLDV